MIFPATAGRRPAQELRSSVDPLEGEHAMTLNGWTMFARPGRADGAAINEGCWPNIGFYPVDVHWAGEQAFSMLAALALRRIAPGDRLAVDYGESYQGVRVARAYTVARRCGPAPPLPRITSDEAEEAVRQAFTTEELLRLRQFGGVDDSEHPPGSAKHPTRPHGGAVRWRRTEAGAAAAIEQGGTGAVDMAARTGRAEAEAVRDALTAMMGDGQTAERLVHGWRLRTRCREGREGAGPRTRADVEVWPPGCGRSGRLRAIGAVYVALGLEQDGAEEVEVVES